MLLPAATRQQDGQRGGIGVGGHQFVVAPAGVGKDARAQPLSGGGGGRGGPLLQPSIQAMQLAAHVRRGPDRRLRRRQVPVHPGSAGALAPEDVVQSAEQRDFQQPVAVVIHRSCLRECKLGFKYTVEYSCCPFHPNPTYI